MWNGSTLGEILPETILEKYSVDISASSSEESSPKTLHINTETKKHKRTQEYWYITIHNIGQWVAVKPLKTYLPVIIDELKPLFGLSKIGTHTAILKERRYILFHQNGQTNRDIRPYRDLRLSEAPKDILTDYFRELVQYTYSFRMVIGATCSFDRNIVIRKQNDWNVPISTGENAVNFQRNRISKTTIKRWFGEVRPDFAVQAMLGLIGLDSNNVSEKLSKLRSDIEKTIFRIDKNEIWISAHIMNRIQKASEAPTWERKDTAEAIQMPEASKGIPNSVIERALSQVKLKEEKQPVRRSTRVKK